MIFLRVTFVSKSCDNGSVCDLSTSILSLISKQTKDLSLVNSLNTDAKKMKNTAESVTLTQGWHQWLVKKYLVDKKLYNSFQTGINQYELDVFKLKKEYAVETDPLKKQAIQSKVYNIEGLILKMKSEQFNLMKELGNHVFVNFEVL